MPENVFKTADELKTYHDGLLEMHNHRIQQLLELQYMWEAPIRVTETGRTVYMSNEPAVATRLTVSLVTAGKPYFQASMPPNADIEDRERSELQEEIERFIRAHFHNVDISLWDKRQGDNFLRQWTYHAAVYGWHAGINLVLDGIKDDAWPILTEIWDPLDTYPEMDGSSGLTHIRKIKIRDLEKKFGPKRPGGKIKGYTFTKAEGQKDSDCVQLIEYWDNETSAIIVINKDAVEWIKPQTPHKLGHNPAWCAAIDAVPFRHTATTASGDVALTPDFESTRYLEYTGQSPMLLYKTAYRYKTELMNQIADVIERWSKGAVAILETADGRYQEVDLEGGVLNQLPAGSRLHFVEPPKFPQDDRAWLGAIEDDIIKGSYPRAAYGAVGSTEAAYTLQLMRSASGYIIEPIVQQCEMMLEMAARSILIQLEKVGKQYAGKFFAARSKSVKRTRAAYEFFDISNFPKGVRVAVSIKGAGIQSDRMQTLALINQVANSANPILAIETLLDEFLEIEEADDEVAKLFWQKMTSSKEVYDTAGPVVTLYNIADMLRMKSKKKGDRAEMLADAFTAQAQAGIDELKASAAQSKLGPEPAPAPSMDPASAAAFGAAAGAGSVAPPPGMEGLAPPGAPIAGGTNVATPSAGRGIQMNMADIMNGTI